MRSTLRAALCTVALVALSPAGANAQNASPATPYIEAVRQSAAGELERQMGIEAIRGYPAPVAADFRTWFERNAHTMPPTFLFAYADRIFAEDRLRAASWFLAARTRMFYDALRCSDQSVLERVAQNDLLFEELVAHLQAHPADATEAGAWALQWDQATPLPRDGKRLLQFCLSGARGLQLAVDQGKLAEAEERPTANEGVRQRVVPMPDVEDPDEWIVPQAEYAAAHQLAREVTARVVANLTGPGDGDAAGPQSGQD